MSGEEHPHTLSSMASLALMYRDQGRWKEAEDLEVQVSEPRKRVLGEEHPPTMSSMAHLTPQKRGHTGPKPVHRTPQRTRLREFLLADPLYVIFRCLICGGIYQNSSTMESAQLQQLSVQWATGEKSSNRGSI